MKDIAHHRHTGLRWQRITVFVFAFALGISLVGLSSFKNLEETWLEIFPKHAVFATVVGALALAAVWSLLIALFGLLFGRVLTWQTTWGLPRYFFYAFKFSDGSSIVGWMRIQLNPSNGTLDAIGKSFGADKTLAAQESVSWTSDFVSGGTFHGHATCYILYNLNEPEAAKIGRPYRAGLLRFRQLRASDLKDGAEYPEASSRGEEQYFGNQQAIDKDGVWNLAYAESTEVDQETDAETDKALTHDLAVRRESLLLALANLEKNLNTTKI